MKQTCQFHILPAQHATLFTSHRRPTEAETSNEQNCNLNCTPHFAGSEETEQMAESNVAEAGLGGTTPEASVSKKGTMKIMVAVDDSEESFYALIWALDYVISGEDGGMVTVVNVQHPFQHYIYPAGPAVYATNNVLESVRKAQEENSAVVLGRAMQICKAKMVRAETLILNGDPKEMICEAAEQMHVDLLVMSSRGLGAIKRAFLGSVSDYCVHHAPCPVLIVKPPKERKP